MADSFAETYGHIYTIASVINVIIFSYILLFLYKLETTGCECAMDWRRKYIMAFCIIMICLAIFETGVSISHKDPMQVLKPIRVYMMPIYIGLTIVFIISTFQYVHKLKREKCRCADDMAQTVMFIVAAIDAAVFVVIGVMMIIGILAFISK